jgi:predicted dehydrogenase
MKLRVGVVGLGDQWQTRHLPALRALSDRFVIRAVCSQVAERASVVAREFDADAVGGFRAIVERDDIDVVLALAPEWYGPLPILAACDAGKAVFSSAALDVTPDEALELRQRIEASGVAFMAELPRRHSPATVRLKELIATRLGPPQLLFCHERLPIEDQLNAQRRGDHCPLAWRTMMELADWCCYLVDDTPESLVSSVHSQSDTNQSPFYQMVSLSFPGKSSAPAVEQDQVPSDCSALSAIKPLAQLSVGHYIPRQWSDALSFKRPASIQVCCQHGMAFIDLPSSLIWFDDAGQHTESLEFERPVGEQMLDRFYRAVTSLIRRTTDPQDAYRAMQIVVGAAESAATGNRVMFKDQPS